MTAANRSIRCCGTLRSWLLLFPLAFFFTAVPFVGVAPEIFSGSNEDRHLLSSAQINRGRDIAGSAGGLATTRHPSPVVHHIWKQRKPPAVAG
jgi:hypothetical protein